MILAAIIIIILVALSYSKPKPQRYDPTPTRIKQMLETAYIFEHTKRIDTLSARYVFGRQLAVHLSKSVNNKNYKSQIEEGVQKYYSLYYDRIISDFQSSFVLYPNKVFDTDLYAKIVVASFSRICQDVVEQINNLKTNSAKHRRIEKLANTSILYKEELSKYDRTEYHQFIDRLLCNISDKHTISNT